MEFTKSSAVTHQHLDFERNVVYAKSVFDIEKQHDTMLCEVKHYCAYVSVSRLVLGRPFIFCVGFSQDASKFREELHAAVAACRYKAKDLGVKKRVLECEAKAEEKKCPCGYDIENAKNLAVLKKRTGSLYTHHSHQDR